MLRESEKEQKRGNRFWGRFAGEDILYHDTVISMVTTIEILWMKEYVNDEQRGKNRLHVEYAKKGNNIVAPLYT